MVDSSLYEEWQPFQVQSGEVKSKVALILWPWILMDWLTKTLILTAQKVGKCQCMEIGIYIQSIYVTGVLTIWRMMWVTNTLNKWDLILSSCRLGRPLCFWMTFLWSTSMILTKKRRRIKLDWIEKIFH